MRDAQIVNSLGVGGDTLVRGGAVGATRRRAILAVAHPCGEQSSATSQCNSPVQQSKQMSVRLPPIGAPKLRLAGTPPPTNSTPIYSCFFEDRVGWGISI